jgi:histidinol-phosphate aminotransferase
MESTMKRNSILDFVKQPVRDIAAYTLKEYEFEVKINQNENPYDVPAELKQRILDYAADRSWSRYPPFEPERLYDLLAEYTDWLAEGILAGNGSNEIIHALFTVFISPGDRLVLPSPTFTVYQLMGTVMGADIVTVPLNPDYSFDCDAIENAAAEGGMTIICTPNNPTGMLYPRDRLERLLTVAEGPVVVDEAYFEFSRTTAVDLLPKFDNLVVLRTFSKAFSLAGLRFGYGLMDPDLAREVDKATLPYNLNFFTLAAAEILLENRDVVMPTIDEILVERDKLIPAMNEIPGVTAYPSSANFILFETSIPPADVFDRLLEDGFLVRNVSSYPMLGRALRVTVSYREDNVRFLESLKKVMDTAAQA